MADRSLVVMLKLLEHGDGRPASVAPEEILARMQKEDPTLSASDFRGAARFAKSLASMCNSLAWRLDGGDVDVLPSQRALRIERR